MPEFSGVHHINLTVTDLERSAQWYVDVLGLTRGWEMPNVEGRGRKIVLPFPGSSVRLTLTQHEANDGQPASEFRTGLDHLAFTVADREALEDWIRLFQEHGVDHTEIKEGATGWLVVFRDPDNIQLEMYTQSK